GGDVLRLPPLTTCVTWKFASAQTATTPVPTSQFRRQSIPPASARGVGATTFAPAPTATRGRESRASSRRRPTSRFVARARTAWRAPCLAIAEPLRAGGLLVSRGAL